MKRATLAIAGVALALAAVPTAGHADPEGCIAVGTHWVNPGNANPWDCFFTATGPSYYVAATTNPFVIAIARHGGAWDEVVRRPTPGAPEAGRLDTQPGDRVSVSISCWDYVERAPCDPFDSQGGRDGVIVAHSQP